MSSFENPTDLTGTILAGRYRILKKLGEGAMGAVYLGEHIKIGRKDAIKVLRDGLAMDPEAIARFNRGARNVAAIRHPNVCTIYDYSDTADGTQFLAMQFVAGESLKDLLDREGRLPLERAVRIAKQTADALEAAHDAGIVHRDLKPANIMISRGRNGEDQVTVVDFDIAKGSTEGEGGEVTRLGFVVGTPEYMSPEQLTGDRLDGRSDVYSLAMVLFRMLTGALPFTAQTTQELMVKRLTQDPLRLDEVLPDVSFPPEIQCVLDRGLARRAEDRYPSAEAFGNDLMAAVGWLGTGGGVAMGAGGMTATGGVSALGATWSGTGATGSAGTVGRLDDIPQTRVERPVTATGAASTAAAGSTREAGGRKTGIIVGAGVAAVAIVVLAVFALRGPSGGASGTPATSGSPPTASSGETAGGQAGTGLVAGSPDQLAQTDPPAGNSGNTAASPPQGSAGSSTTASPAQPAGTSTSSATPSTPSAPQPSQPATAAIVVPVDQASDIVMRQLDMLGPPDPPRPVLTAIRDTADAIWRLSSAPASDRALAAYVAGSAWLALGNPAQCATWLERAIQLRPDTPGYEDLLEFCRSGAR